MKPYQVVFSPEAAEDLERLFDHILERELASAVPVDTTPAALVADSSFNLARDPGRACLWQQWDFDADQQAFVLAKRGRLPLAD